MKIITAAFAFATITTTAVTAQSLPVGTSYDRAREILDARDRPTTQGSTENDNEVRSTNSQGNIDYNHRIGRRLGHSAKGPERLGKPDQ